VLVLLLTVGAACGSNSKGSAPAGGRSGGASADGGPTSTTRRSPASTARNGAEIKGGTSTGGGNARPGTADASLGLPVDGKYDFFLFETGQAQTANATNIPPLDNQEPWQLTVTGSGSELRSLVWTRRGGSAPDAQQHTVTAKSSVLEGLPLHKDVHGSFASRLDPEPILIFRHPAPGQRAHGVAHGREDNVAVDYEWELEVVGRAQLTYDGRPMQTWHLVRSATERRKQDGDSFTGTFVQREDEWFAEGLGLLVKTKGHEEETTHPEIIYNVDFTLSLECLDGAPGFHCRS
jgi:hypothetical protein